MKRILTIVSLFVLLAGSARAADAVWSSTTGGDYSATANWTGGTLPTPSTAGDFNIAGYTYTVDVFQTTWTNNGITFKPSSATPTTLTFNLHTNTLTSLNFFSPYGMNATGTNTITFYNGILATAGILCYCGPTYSLNVNFTNVTINDTGSTYIGYSNGGGAINVNVWDNAYWLCPSQNIYLGQSNPDQAALTINGNNANVTITGSYNLTVSGQGGYTSSVTIVKGGMSIGGYENVGAGGSGRHGWFLMTGGTNTVTSAINIGGNSAAATNTWGEYYMVGPNYPITTCGTLLMNGLAGTNNWAKLSVSNGFFHATGNATVMNTVQPGSSAQVIVSGSASTMQLDGTTSVGGYQSTSTVSIANGGTLEMGGAVTVAATTSSNTVYVMNNGGTYQFTNANITLTPGTPGNISLTNGTISFRAITNADVLCNQSGGKLDSTNNMAFSGVNYFMLNNATNKASSGQAYTFGTATGTATNWAGLLLTNNACWRWGVATIGSGGVIGGAGVVSNNLTLLSGATWAANTDGSYITVTTNLVLAGALALHAGFTTPAQGMVLAKYGGSVSGTLTGIPTGFTLNTSTGVVQLLPASTGDTTFPFILLMQMKKRD